MIRNFWVEADVEGRETILSGGPRAKDGGMRITLYQRSDGQSVEILSIDCRAEGGKLITELSRELPINGFRTKR